MHLYNREKFEQGSRKLENCARGIRKMTQWRDLERARVLHKLAPAIASDHMENLQKKNLQ